MIVDRNRVYDGFDSLEQGVDAGRKSNIIGSNQVVSAENMVFRGGIAAVRPPISQLILNYTNPANTYHPDGTYSSNQFQFPGDSAISVFQDGIMQCATYFAPHTNETEMIIAMIGGRMFKIVPRETTCDITDITLPYRNRSNIQQTYIIQADKWIVIQDGESLPIIFDGSTARRAKETEVVVGTIMAYGMGRIVVIRGNDIFFGDLYGSHPGDDPADSIIQFTETTFLSEGFPASIPFALGRITGAAFFPQLDTSTGLGELMVFTERGAASFFLSLPRDQWKTSGFQKVALLTTGLRGWRSIATVNEDLFFRADDGERSFRQARAEPGGWFHLPLSTNVSQWMDNDTPQLLDFASAIAFDNRIIQTCTPIWNQGKPYHNGLLVLDFDILSSFGASQKPAWNGHWSGIKTTQLVAGTFAGKRRAFAFGLDDNNQNVIYELQSTGSDDFSGKIPWEIVTRAFDFSRDQSSSPFTEKELYMGDIWLDGITDDDFEMNLNYRPDGYPNWLPWDSVSNLNQIQVPNDPNLVGLTTTEDGFAPRATLRKPDDKTDPTTKRNLRRGFDFEVKMDGVGHAEITRFRIQAQNVIEKSRAR